MVTLHNTRNAPTHHCGSSPSPPPSLPWPPASPQQELHSSISPSWGFSLTRYRRTGRKGGQEDYSLNSKCFHILQWLKQEHMVIWESWDAGTLPVLHTDLGVFLCIHGFYSCVPCQEKGQGSLLDVDILPLHALSVPVLANWYDIVYLTVLPPVT